MSHHTERAQLAWVFANVLATETQEHRSKTISAALALVDRYFIEPGTKTKVIESVRYLV